jgi:hypothetical protein
MEHRRWQPVLPAALNTPEPRAWGFATQVEPTERGAFNCYAEMACGGFSSFHVHPRHANRFSIEAGVAAVFVERPAEEGYDVFILDAFASGYADRTIHVHAGAVHAFACLSDRAVVFERYLPVLGWAQSVPTIRRFTKSGRLCPDAGNLQSLADILASILDVIEAVNPEFCCGLANSAKEVEWPSRKE